jgi:uncharacterized protein
MDLEFNVAQLMKDPVGASRTYQFDEPTLLLSEAINEADKELVAYNVRGRAKVTRLNGRLRAEGGVQAGVVLRCSRCLEDFTLPVQSTFDEIFLQTYDVNSGLPIRHEPGQEEDPDQLTIDHNHLLNLGELVRQTILVSLPLQPLHDEDCLGLCPTCGKNLNEGPCDCPTESLDPRFAALAQLLADEQTADRFTSN